MTQNVHTVVNYDHKKLYIIGPRTKTKKTFSIHFFSLQFITPTHSNKFCQLARLEQSSVTSPQFHKTFFGIIYAATAILPQVLTREKNYTEKKLHEIIISYNTFNGRNLCPCRKKLECFSLSFTFAISVDKAGAPHGTPL